MGIATCKGGSQGKRATRLPGAHPVGQPATNQRLEVAVIVRRRPASGGATGLQAMAAQPLRRRSRWIGRNSRPRMELIPMTWPRSRSSPRNAI